MLHLSGRAFLGVVLGCCCLCLLVGASPARGQMASDGTLNLVVTDQSGGVVEGASAELRSPGTNRVWKAETQGLGSAVFARIPLGTYRLTVTKSNFKSEVVETVVIEGGRVTDLKVTLTVGAASETIEVTTSAVPLIETTSNALNATIDLKQIEDLPLQGRDISALAQLTPGYSGTPGYGTWNGLPLAAQGNTIDGVASSTNRMKFGGNVQPGLEARLEDIQEMTVQTGQMDTSQGMGGQTMQVNFITRSGTNSLHGRIFEDFRNTVLNANSWTNNAEGLPRNVQQLNSFGGSVGGHIIKDKLFFFASFSMFKQPGSYTAGNVALTPLAQSGVFTDSNGNQINLFTTAGNNGLTGSGYTTVNPAISSQQALINKAITTPGTVLSANGDPNLQNVNWLVPSPITEYFPAFRLDYNVTQKVHVDFEFNETKYSQPGAAAPPFPGADFANQAASNSSNNYIGSLGISWTITPTLINQFRGGYYYNAAFYSTGSKPTWDNLDQISWAEGNSGQWFNLPVTTFYPVINFSDNLSWTHGKHSAMFGMDFHREQDHYWNPPDGIPNIGLGLAGGDPATNAFNTALASESSSDVGGAEALYATLIGRISGVGPVGSGFPYNQKTGQYATKAGTAFNLDELQKNWGMYGQDAFRLTPRLTVNFGLRWDFMGDDHDLTSAYHGADAAQIYGVSPIAQSFSPGTLSSNTNPAYVASSHQYPSYNVTPQPTIGLAWNPSSSGGLLNQLLGGSGTVIRAGFDIKRFTEPYQFFWNNASNYGKAFFQAFALNPGTSEAAGSFNPGSLTYAENPATNLPPYSVFPAQYSASLDQSLYTYQVYFSGAGIDRNIKQPYLMEWNLGIQRQIGSSNVLEVRYLGHRAIHQWIAVDTNEVNIFENGFLKEFQAAQSNLKIYQAANPGCATAGTCSFANSGLAGQVNLPIMSTAFGGASSTDFTNSAFVTDLERGAAGALGSVLAYPNSGNFPYICNLVGSSLSPCGPNGYGYDSPGAYPVNFMQSNPYLDSYYGGAPASFLTSQGYGNYHALQVDFRQKQWHGMNFDVNYTFSHTLGLQPDNSWTGNTGVFSIRNLRLDYGPTLFDLRHVLHASGTYDLPFGRGKTFLGNSHGVVDRLVGGWTIGTILTIDSGFPFQLYGGYLTYNDYGDGGMTLNGTPVSALQNAIGVYPAGKPAPYKYTITPSLATQTATSTCSSRVVGICQNITAGTFGDHPWLAGPRIWNDDMSLSKTVPITERIQFRLQAEFLNVFNHPNWADPNANISSSAFGESGLSNINGPRVIELRANITF
jgi:Carboxypeptidase regulatory-like domain